jgi:large subunit ribosomal protein L4
MATVKKPVKKPTASAVKVGKPVKKAVKAVVAKTKKPELVAETVAIKGKSVEKSSGMQMSVVGIDGKHVGTVTLPEALFGAKVNEQLVAQAVRVYLANQRQGSAASKTRGMVEGSTRKIYKQKGTGRARHGGIRAPIFVGGGTAFGPHPHAFAMAFPQKMRRVALASALSLKKQEGNIVVVSGMEKMLPKTKEMATFLAACGATNCLLLVPAGWEGITRSARNIESVETIDAASTYAYGVLAHKTIVIPKESLAILEKTFIPHV